MGRGYKSSDKTVIKNIKKEREHICYYCNKQIKEEYDLTVDHKEPYNGVNTTYENCVISCTDCNGEKRCMNEVEFRDYLSYKSEMSQLSQEQLIIELEKIILLLRSGIPQEQISLGRKAQALRRLIKF